MLLDNNLMFGKKKKKKKKANKMNFLFSVFFVKMVINLYIKL